MPLSDLEILKVKPLTKSFKMSDGGGLFLLVNPTGSKWWRFKYRFSDKEKLLSLGVYPDVPLKLARERREDARKLIAQGIDPGDARKQQKAARFDLAENCFEKIARQWFLTVKAEWTEKHAEKVLRRLERDAFPWLGVRPMNEITPPEVLAVIRRVEARAAYTAKRVKENIGQAFRYGIQEGHCERDPTADLKGALRPVKVKHFAALLEPKDVAEMLRAFDGFKGTFVVTSALRLAPLVFVRPGELRQAEWAHIDLERGEWRFIASKTRTDHLVPLASQAVAILRELQPLTGQGQYVFSGRDTKKPMSDATIGAALRRMGYDTQTDVTGHGFRAMARTLLHEELGFRPEVIEHQLAHRVPDALGEAYNRTRFIKDRKVMMQAWADYLDKLRAGAVVIPINHAA